MIFYRIRILILGITCLISQVQAQTSESKPVTKSEVSNDAPLPFYRRLLNVSYSQDDKENILDAYIPTNYDNAKVIVYLHGSGWTGGDKNEFPEMLIDELVGKRKYLSLIHI